MSDRPRIGVSSCLLGERVRWDAGHKRDAWLVEVFGPHVEWVPVCPEVEAGFGTPREPMTLIRTMDRVALVTTQTGRDMTAVLRGYAERRLNELTAADLDGYVLKSDSPSCGAGEGLFASALMARLPHLPVIDERQLAVPEQRRAFLERVFAGSRSRAVDVLRVRRDVREAACDRAAVEEPLEIRLHGQSFAVLMRTPGDDRELAAGFLFSERVITNVDDLGTIEYCTEEEQPQSSQRAPANSARSAVASGNTVNVTLANRSRGAVERLLAERRQVMGSSSCGLCGRLTIESLATDVAPIRAAWTVRATSIAALPDRLRAGQTVFDETGGLHAAALFTPGGELVDIAEDVGRHNAVDKIVGRQLMRETLPLSDRMLCVTGRTSYEIVQKAVLAGIPIVAAVSAPSSLAIDLAEELGVTLVGFVRGGSFNIYSHSARIETQSL